jgi:hypothetical protein
MLSIIFLVNTNPSAYADFSLPLPLGKHEITNDTAGHNEYQPWDDYSLDFQAAKIPDQEETKITRARCWSYGAPILASKAGVVTQVVYLSVRHSKPAGYGAHVRLKHNDGSTGIYAHMINDSNKIYVKKGDQVEQNQILGLMGDTGSVSIGNANNPCLHDTNYGTHLHYELRHHEKDPNFGKDKEVITSKTRPFDKANLYANNHFGKYPYIPQVEQVHSVSPLVAKPRSRTQFLLKGKYFYKDSDFSLPFCISQQLTTINEQLIKIDCETKNQEGTHLVKFPNLSQTNGQLRANFQLTHNPNPLSISQVTFIPPHPGEMLVLNISGTGLHADLDISIQSQNDPSEEGSCNFKNQFTELSPTKIIVQCRLPLNLGPVKQNNNQQLAITISSNNQTLYQDQLEINYGISSPHLSPLQATYNVPTQFSITGKNVHRSTIFYIENCKQDQFRIIEQLYNKVIFECLITPKNDGSSSHQFFFKTKSRYNKKGQKNSDEEDQANIILSGYITMIHDEKTRVESISPAEAVIGEETLFTVTGNRLPYSDDKIPLIWMEDCKGHGKNGAVEVIPESYSHTKFQFRCTPQFAADEQAQYEALEQKYTNDDRKAKEKLWPEFTNFFKKMKPRKLHIKTARKTSNELLSEQSVRFSSSLYEFIREEEQFQFQYLREDGLYQITGPPEVDQIETGSISRNNRHQVIKVSGQSLPYDLSFASDDCAQVAISYGSSEKFEAICLLKKVALQELQIIDSKKGELIETYQSKLVEVYDVQASWKDQDSVLLDIRGVHLLQKLKISSEDCNEITEELAPSSSQILMLCTVNSSQFSRLEAIKVKITSEDGVTLWNKSVKIQSKPIASSFKILSSSYSLQTTNSSSSSLKPPASSKRSALYPDLHSPLLRQAVTELTQLGLIEGHPDNSFRADESYDDQTRSDFVAKLIKSLPYYLDPIDHTVSLKQYTDLSSNSEFLPEITFALLNDIIPKSSSFNPDEPINRGDAALIMHKAQQLLINQNPSPEKEREELVRAEG